MVKSDGLCVLCGRGPRERRLCRVIVPGPCIAKPDRRQKPNRGGFGTAIARGDAHEKIIGAGLGVFDNDIEVAVLPEGAGVEKFELGILLRAASIFRHQFAVGKSPLRILVEKLHVRVRGRGVEMKVILLHVFAVVSFISGQAEEPFLENGIGFVPESEAETDILMTVANGGESVLVPTVGARAGLVVRKVLPGFSRGAVVLANRAPGPVTDVRSPALPVCLASSRFFETFFFRIHGGNLPDFSSVERWPAGGHPGPELPGRS